MVYLIAFNGATSVFLLSENMAFYSHASMNLAILFLLFISVEAACADALFSSINTLPKDVFNFSLKIRARKYPHFLLEILIC
ncbi:MAG: hypothetical protein RPR97_01190 [Colwellia sp.]|jgi:hypothetical protein